MATDAPARASITGKVLKTFTQSEKFTAGVIDTGSGTHRFAVHNWLKVDEEVTLRGYWTEHPQYGWQFKANEIVCELPTDDNGLVRWLGDNIKGIGPVRARKMVESFPGNLMKMCGDDPQQVAIETRVDIELVQTAAETWGEQGWRAAAYTLLCGELGLTRFQAEMVLKTFKRRAVEVIREDPYQLLGRVDGLGWKRVDEIALKTGKMANDDPRRIAAAAVYAVTDLYERDGTTAVHAAEALEVANRLTGVEVLRPAVDAAFAEAVSDERLSETAGYYSPPFAYRDEVVVLRMLAAMGRELISFNPENCPPGLASDESQMAAIQLALSYRGCVITGGAGSGKTTIIDTLCKITPGTVMLAAPTGKAARRMEEITKQTASTIHRLLGYSPHTGRFTHGKDDPLPSGLLIVDEVSMCDTSLLASLFAAVGPKTRVVLVGDANQLPPVGPGAVLRDAIAERLCPVARLEHCHRNAGVLKQNCNAVLTGIVAPTVKPAPGAMSPWIVQADCDAPKVIRVLEKLYTRHLAAFGFKELTDWQVMTARHDGPLGTKKINRALQALHQLSIGVDVAPAYAAAGTDRADDEGRPLFFVGDKVIHTKNNYELNVMNGTVGVVLEAGDKPVMKYPDGEVVYATAEHKRQMDLAYCLSVHKMQGSETRCAIVIVPKAHSFMMHRAWLYTAVTRAQQSCIILGDDYGIRHAAERTQIDKRRTLLQVFAASPHSRPA